MREAYLESGFGEAARGAVAVCRGKAVWGGLVLRAQYVSFERGKVAAARMLNRPPFFDSFAASIRHSAIDDRHSELIYRVNFAARPRWLRVILHPLMRAVFVWETRRRLRALKNFFRSRASVE